jgi:hypothetical protein
MLVNYVAIFGGSSREDLISKLVFFVANMWLFFKVWRHGWQFNSMRSMHHLLLVSIAWHIRVTWQCNHSWTYHWLWRSKPCCIYIYIYISHSFRRGIWSMQSWQKKLKQGGKIFHNVKTWKSWCLHLPNMFCNTKKLLWSKSKWVITMSKM